MRKKFFALFSVTLVIAAIGAYYTLFIKSEEMSTIDSFEECAAAGYSIMESYPAQCSTKEGKTFTENIGNEMEMTDTIKISSPRPNQYLVNPVTITGEARGTWFFEATAPVKLVDEAGNIVAQGYITAVVPTATPQPTSTMKKPIKKASNSAEPESTWMTTEFVPFTGQLTFTTPDTPKATLILEKSNPSDLPQNAAELKIPVYLK